MDIKIEVELLINSLAEVSDLFYKQMNATAQSKLVSLYDEIEKVMNILGKQSKDLDIKKINNSLMEAMTAMENQDNILLADIIKYDLIDYFKNII